MLQIKDLHYHIGERQLLKGVNWMIQPGKRAALIGPNGAGKTTLLRILNGELEYHDGSIIKPKMYRIGYLPQEEIAMEGHSILQTVLDGQIEIIALEKEITRLHHALDSPESGDSNIGDAARENLLKRLGDLEHEFEILDGYHVENSAKSILSGLGFSKNDLSRPITEFSGGWRMRVYLALLLVRKPDLLLMDEPTNHLDLPSLEWLEQYLLGFKGSIIAVSHDRFFIDRLAQEIVDLDRGQLVHYSGNYHAYEKQKEQRDALLLKNWKEQKEERERQERFINRFRYKDSKASQVQSRIKLLEKMETIDIEPPPPRIDFTLKVDVPSYKDVLAIRDMSFRYERDWVLQNIDLNLYRGDRVSLVGVNGAGKTTLTRLIVDQLKPEKGSVELGQRVQVGYYAQHQVETLNLEYSVYDEVASTVATSLVPRIRDVLGLFQFKGQDVFKKIGVLSGGEKARVSLAKILLSPVNFLIMDEPTNHLDKFSRETLEDALATYPGTLLLISHDRYFLDKLVHRVLHLQDGSIEEYDGNYSEYLEKREKQRKALPTLPFGGKTLHSNRMATAGKSSKSDQNGTVEAACGSAKKTKEQKRLEAEARQSISKERNRLQKEVDAIEDRITLLEESRESLETRMAQPETYDNSELAVKLQKEYGAVVNELEELNPKWEEAHLELEEMISRLP